MKTGENFFEKFKELKKDKKWQKIIEIFLQDIKYTNLNFYQKAQINLVLSNCYLHLGNFKEAINFAEKGRSISEKNKDINLLCTSYYLLSKSYRIKALQSRDPREKSSSTILAYKWSNKGLEQMWTWGVLDFTRGKIFMNHGDIKKDIERDLESAETAYSKAALSFGNNRRYKTNSLKAKIKQIECRVNFDKFRNFDHLDVRNQKPQLVPSSFIKEELKQRDAYNLRTYITDIFMKDLEKSVEPYTKIYLHILELKAEISCMKKKYNESCYYIGQAINLAREKNMTNIIPKFERFKTDLSKILHTQETVDKVETRSHTK